MPFIKYQHVERYGTTETNGILDGVSTAYVFPKIDGTNGSIWMEEGELHFASRNREVSLDNDNQGFMDALHDNDNLKAFFTNSPQAILYGEWLVPHTLKDYAEDAWRNFYVFDVCYVEDGVFKYVPYEEYKGVLELYNIDYVPAYWTIKDADEDRLNSLLAQNTFLMQEGGIGEGIVIKRYDFVNKYGRTVWAKVVRSDFKAQHRKAMGPQLINHKDTPEYKITDKFLTAAMVEKVYAKIINDVGEWHPKLIPRLLHTVYHDLVSEECWNWTVKLKNPTVNFSKLFQLCTATIKILKPELF